MEYRLLSAFHYPSTAVLVDDNPNFLASLELNLQRHAVCRSFTDPLNALTFLKKQKPNQLINECLRNDVEYFSPGKQAVVFELNVLPRMLLNAERFNEISVIILDYSMPELNGLQFCERLQQLPLSAEVIMLTGEADQQLAVELFNMGRIAKFILKNTERLEDKVLAAVNEVQKKYFAKVSASLIEDLAYTSASCFRDQNFIELFQKTCQANNIEEYYLLDNSGSYLLINNKSEELYFIVRTQEDLNTYYELALDQGLAYASADQIIKGERIPFFLDHEVALQISGDKWEDFLYPATVVKHKSPYFYALVTDGRQQLFDKKQKVTLFAEYQQGHEKNFWDKT